MNDPLDAEQMNELMRELVALDADAASEDEAFLRLAALFNRCYGMGQEHERTRRRRTPRAHDGPTPEP